MLKLLVDGQEHVFEHITAIDHISKLRLGSLTVLMQNEDAVELWQLDGVRREALEELRTYYRLTDDVEVRWADHTAELPNLPAAALTLDTALMIAR